MKKQLSLLTILFMFCSFAFAQTSNAILFTENGEKFTAIINGLRQNDKPETNVKITGLNAEWYKLKVIFENTALGEKNFNLGVQLGNETSYSIKKNSKGEYVLRLGSSVPIAEAPTAPASQSVVVYDEHPAATVTHSKTTTTTTTHSGNPNNVNINMGVNGGEEGGNVSINVSGMDDGTTQTQTTTTTTVTHSTTSTNTYQQDPPPPHNYLLGYTGPVGCTPPMTPAEFSEMKGTISSKSFEETKITIAKQVMNSRCMFASQVRDLLKLFSFEESKLDIAKYAYDHTYDIGNYYKLNDAFTFESSTEELNQYINSRK